MPVSRGLDRRERRGAQANVDRFGEGLHADELGDDREVRALLHHQVDGFAARPDVRSIQENFLALAVAVSDFPASPAILIGAVHVGHDYIAAVHSADVVLEDRHGVKSDLRVIGLEVLRQEHGVTAKLELLGEYSVEFNLGGREEAAGHIELHVR